jgi:hypothetical protein
MRKEDPLVRLMRKVVKDNISGCWNWTGNTTKGYGQFRIGKSMVYTHRFSFEVHKGQIPDKMLVCHTCDNTRCLNPDHLWIGSNKENSEDKVKKGRESSGRGEKNGSVLYPERLARGSRHWRSRFPEKVKRGEEHWTKKFPEKLKPRFLTKNQVEEIRYLYFQGKMSKKNLAVKFCIGGTTINQILEDPNWTKSRNCSIISEKV